MEARRRRSLGPCGLAWPIKMVRTRIALSLWASLRLQVLGLFNLPSCSDLRSVVLISSQLFHGILRLLFQLSEIFGKVVVLDCSLFSIGVLCACVTSYSIHDNSTRSKTSMDGLMQDNNLFNSFSLDFFLFNS